MAVIQLPVAEPDAQVLEQTRLRVLVKHAWADEWQEHAYLQPLSAMVCAAPGVSRATFRYDYGRIKREDLSLFVDWDPEELEDCYARIQVMGEDGPWALWTGIISGEERQPDGGDVAASSGVQTFTAWGLEMLLDRIPIDRGYVLRGSSPATDDVFALGRAPIFNDPGGHGLRALGNRTTIVPTNGYGAHAFQADSGEYWNARDIASYTVRRFSPADLQFAIAGQLDVLENLRTTLDPESLTAWGLLNKLIDRRRGVGFFVDGNGDQPVLRVFTTIGQPVSVGGEGGVVIPSNIEQRELDLSSNILAGDPKVKRITNAKFDRIIVRGSRLKVTFTASFADGTLEELWTVTEAIAYKQGTGTPADAAERHDAARSRDALERVYCSYRLPRSWGWTAGNGSGIGTKLPVAMKVNKDGSVDAATLANCWNDGRKLERQLVIPAEAGTAAGQPEFVKPLVFIRSPEDSRWYQVDRITQPADAGDDEVNDQKLDEPMPVKLLDRDSGFILKPKIPHILGLGHFSAATSPESDTEPLYDYENIVATLCIQTDEHLQVAEELVASEQSGQEKTLVIEVPDAEYHRIVAGTVVGVKETDGSLQRTTDDPDYELVKRDDGPRLRAIAAMAKAYYGQARATVSFALREITAEHLPGVYFSQIVNGKDVQALGTIVSSVAWDFLRMQTAVTTGYLELDLSGMSVRQAPDERSLARALARLAAKLAEQGQQLAGLPLRDVVAGRLATFGK